MSLEKRKRLAILEFICYNEIPLSEISKHKMLPKNWCGKYAECRKDPKEMSIHELALSCGNELSKYGRDAVSAIAVFWRIPRQRRVVRNGDWRYSLTHFTTDGETVLCRRNVGDIPGATKNFGVGPKARCRTCLTIAHVHGLVVLGGGDDAT